MPTPEGGIPSELTVSAHTQGKIVKMVDSDRFWLPVVWLSKQALLQNTGQARLWCNMQRIMSGEQGPNNSEFFEQEDLCSDLWRFFAPLRFLLGDSFQTVFLARCKEMCFSLKCDTR